jgi:hypothetical protein
MLFKSLDENNLSPYASMDYTPYLPKNGKPGKWLPKVTDLSMCESGYHGCKDGDILEYLNANIYEIETRGKVLDGDDKFTAQQIRLVRKCDRWNEVNARLFACECAARSLKFFEKEYPEDKRPSKCIETARKYARGKATKEELDAARDAASAAARDAASAAARDAASAAARAAASDAARDAESAAAWAAAWDVARDAARDAVRDAAWAAAWAAARAAARDATWAAARDATLAAAWTAASAAAWTAASAAASAAAWAAAWDAEEKWQTRRLLKLLK